jgi:hypothetical protein
VCWMRRPDYRKQKAPGRDDVLRNLPGEFTLTIGDRLGDRPPERSSAETVSDGKAALWLPRRNCTTAQRFGLGLPQVWATDHRKIRLYQCAGPHPWLTPQLRGLGGKQCARLLSLQP